MKAFKLAENDADCCINEGEAAQSPPPLSVALAVDVDRDDLPSSCIFSSLIPLYFFAYRRLITAHH